MQFTTIIKCRLPRCNCKTHGIKTIVPPWAEPKRRFTMLFERFAINVLLASKSIESGRALLNLSWDETFLIMQKAVKRGMARREETKIRYAGIDEKSFRKGHKYISVLTDIGESRVLDVVEGRNKEATETLLNTLSEKQQESIEAVSMDMWESYQIVTSQILPNALRVHDKFHIAKYLGEAVDKVRKQEHRLFQKAGSSVLTGTKYLWLSNNWDTKSKKQYASIKNTCIKTSRAWAIKEAFKGFWKYIYRGAALRYFKRWYFWATHSRLPSLIKVAKMLKRHLNEILNYFNHRITNAASESVNSLIQNIKANARGFRNFQNFRTTILFHCGSLRLFPQEIQ